MRRPAQPIALLAILLAILFLSAQATGQNPEESPSETITVEAPGPYRPERTPNLSAAVEEILQRTNAFRQEQGRPSVKTNAALIQAARGFADYMAQHDRYGHQADGQRPETRVEKAGYKYCLVSENIAYQFKTAGFSTEELAQGFFQGWRESPEHRENMLDADMQETGVAVAHSPRTGHFYAVQLFGRPASARMSFTISNKSPLTIQYEVDKQAFDLAPRYTRTHERCRPAEVKFVAGKDAQPAEAIAQKTFRPAKDARLVVQEETPGRYTVTRAEPQTIAPAPGNPQPAPQSGTPAPASLH